MEQLKLPMTFFPYHEYLDGFKRIRKTVKASGEPFKPWKQLALKLYVKTIRTARSGFWWTRPDGRQFFCKSIRQLVARIMDYDGHMLNATLRRVRNTQ